MKFDNRDIRVVWVDLDDTIIDFETNSRHALHRLWAESADVNRVFASAAGWIDTYEKHNRRLWELYGAGEISRSHLRMQRFTLPLCEGGMEPDKALELAGRFDTLYLDFLAREKALIPGSIDLLRWLRSQHLTIGCLSNGFKDVQHRKIRNCGLEPWLDIVVLSDDIGVNKPDPAIFRHAMERTGITLPEAHLMIGDNPVSDIAGALGAGWSAIHFLRHPAMARCPGCTHPVTRLQAIPELFD